MNKTFLLAWLATFVAWMLGSFVVHGMLLEADYAMLTNLYRSADDGAQYFPLMLLAHVVMSGALVWIYARGVDARAWVGQGLRYGLAVALLTAVPTYTIYYAVQPMPGMLAVKQIVVDTVLLLILGVIVAFFHRHQRRA